jgi:hypothetical protein
VANFRERLAGHPFDGGRGCRIRYAEHDHGSLGDQRADQSGSGIASSLLARTPSERAASVQTNVAAV